MPTKEKTYRKRIDRGVKWLDKVSPGWHKKIKVRRLDMRYIHTCICGQLFGSFTDLILGKVEGMERMSQRTAISRGFLDSTDNRDYDLLTELWLEKIKELKQK